MPRATKVKDLGAATPSAPETEDQTDQTPAARTVALPAPPHAFATAGKEGSKSPYRKIEELWEWWHTVDQEHPDRLVAYVYRTWPQCDARLVDASAPKNIDKVGVFPMPGEAYDNGHGAICRHLQQCYGSGGYRLTFADGRTGAGNLAELHITTPWEPDLYPPRLDIRTLLNVPKNGSYIEWLRIKGQRLPWDDTPEPVATSTPALAPVTPIPAIPAAAPGTADAVTALASIATRMLDQQHQKPSSLSAVGEAMEILDKARNMAGNQQGGTPQDQLKAVIEIARTLLPHASGQDRSEIRELLAEVRRDKADADRRWQDRVDKLEAELRAATSRPAAPPPPPPDPVGSLKDALDLMDKVTGMRERMMPDTPAAPAPAAAGASWLNHLPIIERIAGTVINGITQAITAVQQQPQQVQFTPLPQPQGAGAGVGASAGVAPLPPPQKPQTHTQTLDPMMVTIMAVASPAAVWFERGNTGEDFAIWLIDGYGQQAYEQLAAFGKPMLLGAMENYATDAWGHVSVIDPATGGRRVREGFDRFLDSFMDQAAVKRRVEEQE